MDKRAAKNYIELAEVSNTHLQILMLLTYKAIRNRLNREQKSGFLEMMTLVVNHISLKDERMKELMPAHFTKVFDQVEESARPTLERLLRELEVVSIKVNENEYYGKETK